MAKISRKNMTPKQLANLNGVKNRKAKTKAAEEEEQKPSDKEKTRNDWERNHAIITSEFIKLLGQKQKLPSYEEMGKNLGLSSQTIRRHLDDYSIDDFMNKLKIGNEAVLLNLFKQAATGKSEKMMRLFFQCTGVLKNKIDITTDGKPLPAPQATTGFVTLDPTKLPTDVLKAILEHSEGNSV